jgi:16S rRNA processing protein RimM
MPNNKDSQDNIQPAGSPLSGEPVFLVVGKFRHSHGLRGEILMEVVTDFPERIQKGRILYIGESHQPMVVSGRRIHAGNLLLSFDGINTPEAAGRLRNEWVYVPTQDSLPLPDGEYYHHQILGLQVLTEDGAVLGMISDILVTGANDVYMVRSQSGQQILLPAIQSVILEIDLGKKEMLVRLLPGLLPD